MKVPFVSRKRYDEIVYKLESLLCHATGGDATKSTYTLETMMSEVDRYIEDCCRHAEKEILSRKGEWIKLSDGQNQYDIGEYKCSHCGNFPYAFIGGLQFQNVRLPYYCPVCGTYMGGDEEYRKMLEEQKREADSK